MGEAGAEPGAGGGLLLGRLGAGRDVLAHRAALGVLGGGEHEALRVQALELLAPRRLLAPDLDLQRHRAAELAGGALEQGLGGRSVDVHGARRLGRAEAEPRHQRRGSGLPQSQAGERDANHRGELAQLAGRARLRTCARLAAYGTGRRLERDEALRPALGQRRPGQLARDVEQPRLEVSGLLQRVEPGDCGGEHVADEAGGGGLIREALAEQAQDRLGMAPIERVEGSQPAAAQGIDQLGIAQSSLGRAHAPGALAR